MKGQLNFYLTSLRKFTQHGGLINDILVSFKDFLLILYYNRGQMFSPQTNVSKKKKKPGTNIQSLSSPSSSSINKEKDHQNPVGPWGLKTEPR